MFYFFILIVTSLLLQLFDVHKTLEKSFINSIKSKKIVYDNSIVYFLISGTTIFIIQICLIIYWFLIVKNKKLYCQIYLKNDEDYKLRFLFLCLGIIAGIKFFGWAFIITSLQLCTLYLFHHHFGSIEKLKHENNYNNILNYEECNENEDENSELNNHELTEIEYNPIINNNAVNV